MPNWCSTNVTLYAKDEAIIRELSELIGNYSKQSFCKETTGNANWLGNLLCHAGFDYSEVVAGKYGYPRGWIQWVDDVTINESTGYASFTIDIEDAWCPHIQVFREFVNKLYPNNCIHISWIAEEPGCELFQKYDPDNLFYSEYEYNVDIYVPEEKYYEKYPELSIENDGYTLNTLKQLFKLGDITAILDRAKAITEEMQSGCGEGCLNVNSYYVMNQEY